MANLDRRQALALMLCAPACLVAQPRAADEHLPALHDLRPIAAAITRHKAPLLILFSTPGCPFCREVRRNYLAPRLAEQAGRPTPDLLIYEADVTSTRTLLDLSGARTSEADFALRYQVRAVPVVALLDQSLQPIGVPLVGLDRSGFYESYLASAIEAARQRLRQTS